MEHKRLECAKRVLLSVLATVILSLIVVNVSIVQQSGVSENQIKLGSMEVTAETEKDCWGGIGSCAILTDVYNSGNGSVLMVYDCVNGNGNFCQEGFQEYINSNLVREELALINCPNK